MIEAIAKLIPLVAVAGGTAASSPKLKAQITKVLEATKVVAVQQEVSDITKMIYLDTVDGTHPKPENLATYLRENMRNANGIQRDTSMDIWGKPYRLFYNKQRREIVVTSAGPDTNYDTPDDIRGVYPLDNPI